MKKLIAGNWKMNGSLKDADALIVGIEGGIARDPALLETCDFVVCPPFVHLAMVRDRASVVAVGGQDCSDKESGAFTGDISPAMLADLGAAYVILGHSERRQYHEESDEYIAAKARAAHAKGLVTIVCVGETEAEREGGVQDSVVEGQLMRSIPGCASAQNTVVAYEPVWAIGTGKTATAEDIRAMHEFIRSKLVEKLADGQKVRILYGGSVKPGNAAEIFAVKDVNGALIGGASLKTEDFLGIAKSAKG
jgi:triosephosphate isomerase